jgi:leucyl-tRNA---protein transferase
MNNFSPLSDVPLIEADGVPHACVYLPDQIATLAYLFPKAPITSTQFDRQLSFGQRRSGQFLYYMNCKKCRACQPTRVIVDEFELTKSLARVKKRGDAAIELDVNPCSVDHERVDLYNKHRCGRGLGDEGNVAGLNEYREFLVDSCCDTLELSYRIDGRLIGCTIADIGSDALSAVYTYFDVEFEKLSIGTYAVIKLIEYAKRAAMQHVYLGLYVATNPHLRYKARYVPQERRINGEWIRFDEASIDWTAG